MDSEDHTKLASREIRACPRNPFNSFIWGDVGWGMKFTSTLNPQANQPATPVAAWSTAIRLVPVSEVQLEGFKQVVAPQLISASGVETATHRDVIERVAEDEDSWQ